MRHSHAGLRILACLAVGGASGCTGWRQVSVSPSALEGHPSEVRVTRSDGTRLALADPRIAGDSLYGSAGGKEAVLPLGGVSRIAVRQPANAKTAATLTFVAAAAIAVLGWWVYFSAQ